MSLSVEKTVEDDFVKHLGSCHCGSVQFQVFASENLTVFRCNCSICIKKQNNHFIIPSRYFSLLTGDDMLTTYTFNTHQAKHMFCKKCGVQCFYRPRSNPDCYGIMPHCIDSSTIKSIKYIDFDGVHWEQSIDDCAKKEKNPFDIK
ncbi:unnamed protein product [Didymodactylos carnosus]|uniref:CENP-V/GFA domain-containing protein n=1 Tax=Didymodactylos carnosus TaxID=1234261 RepID=A0A813P371_9BILA|nr:unnamed protein product [Didymodactylos carnosus]CAF1081506.1 unnamed protein product [Didymodactylos carnosus]CAF3525632.1 unnamed protein product [Didymodactylos carnosus]CAF3844401.1 unnamed protein product [Didymodactylos carnosus]